MQPILGAIHFEASDLLSVICILAGWFYLFYSQAADRLAVIESSFRNKLRITLRRMCGGCLFLLGVGVYAGFHTFDADLMPRAYAAVWIGNLLVLTLIIVLVYVDLVLTWKLRHRPKPPTVRET